MSHTHHPPRSARLGRTLLAVPASSAKMVAKAADSAADIVLLDLEDAVAPPEKPAARGAVVQALREIDWAGKGKTVTLRVNGLDTPYFYRDVVEVLEGAPDRLDALMLPKTGVPADLYAVDALISGIEAATGAARRVGLEALIETALGMANLEAIAAAPTRRLEAVHLGLADFSASLRARTVSIGGLNPDYPGDPWHAALHRLVVCGRAYGLRVMDGPFGDFRDPEGLTLAAKRAAALGCEGKWAIHPAQLDPINAVFTPPEAEVAQARRIVAALREAEAAGQGAAALDGKMIDAASEKQAATVIAVADALAARG